MPYRAPNAYARFVKTAGAVNNPGATRVMGLIGTGLNYYEIYNEPIQKNDNKPYDELANSNVFEILSVSSKPVLSNKTTPDNKIYQQNTDFELKEGKYLAWKILPSNNATVSVSALATAGSHAFNTKITCAVDANNEHFVEDGEWLVEITYVDTEAGEGSGAYRVINNITKEVVGEYEVSASDKFNVIPGTVLKITSTFVADTNGATQTSIGDYVLITTSAAKTEKEATVAFDKTKTVSDPTTLNYSLDLENSIQYLMIVNSANVQTGTYELSVTDIGTATAPGHFTITNVDTKDVVYSGFVGSEQEYLEVIPGITFVLNKLPADVLKGDTTRIITTARTASNVPTEGSSYYVSYKYRKADEDYNAKIFFDYDDIVAEYGNYDVTATGLVINSLTLGAEIAFQNGVTPVICVQAKNDSDYEMKVAIDKLQRSLPGVSNINTIVPLTQSANVGAYAAKHVDIMSSSENGKERMVYLGAARNQLITKNATALDRSIGMVETASSYKNERVVFVVPGEIVREVRDTRTGKVYDRKLPACYPAVAVAALGLVNDPAQPLTNKTITGFKYLTTVFMESEKNFLAGSGCLVLDQVGSVIKVRHGVTTATADVDSSEITLVQIKDYVIDACRKVTSELYIGNKNRPSIVSDVQYTISSILNQFISQEVILGFSNLSVKRSKDDPRQIDVRFEIEAVYPLNYINITFGFTTLS